MADLQKILICSDLDRTIIPNGYQEESAHCRPVFRKLVEHPNIYLTYLSGRDKKLILDAIEEHYLPMPDYAIGDVGTTLYRIIDGNWQTSDDCRSNACGKDNITCIPAGVGPFIMFTASLLVNSIPQNGQYPEFRL